MAKQVDSTNLGGLLTDLITRIKNAFWRKGETSQLSIDNDPTSGSNNLVKSGGVYSALGGKQDTIDANHKLAYSLLSGTPPEIFPVTYGTTTQTEITTAVAAGKLPVCKYGDNLYVYAGESSADYSQFTSVLYDTAYRIYVKNSTWGSGSYEVYSKPSPILQAVLFQPLP